LLNNWFVTVCENSHEQETGRPLPGPPYSLSVPQSPSPRSARHGAHGLRPAPHVSPPTPTKHKNGGLFLNIPPFCDFVDCHTFTSLSCLTQPLTYNLYHYYLKSFLTCHFSLPQGLTQVLAEISMQS